MDVEAAAIAGAFEERWVAGEPQALLFDARVDGDVVLQFEALAHALPDVLGLLLGLFDRDDQRLLLHPSLVVVRANALGFVELTGALAAHQGGGQGQRTGLDQARQGDGIEGSAAIRRHWLGQSSGQKCRAILESSPPAVNL
ncbi:hypothetical protein D9M73_242340 [compost metagenome]